MDVITLCNIREITPAMLHTFLMPIFHCTCKAGEGTVTDIKMIQGKENTPESDTLSRSVCLLKKKKKKSENLMSSAKTKDTKDRLYVTKRYGVSKAE